MVTVNQLNVTGELKVQVGAKEAKTTTKEKKRPLGRTIIHPCGEQNWLTTKTNIYKFSELL